MALDSVTITVDKSAKAAQEAEQQQSENVELLKVYLDAIKAAAKQGQSSVVITAEDYGQTAFTNAGYTYSYSTNKATVGWANGSAAAASNKIEYTAKDAFDDANAVIDRANTEVDAAILAAQKQEGIGDFLAAECPVGNFDVKDATATYFTAAKSSFTFTPTAGMVVDFVVHGDTAKFGKITIATVETVSTDYKFTAAAAFDVSSASDTLDVTFHNAAPGYQIFYQPMVPTELVDDFEAALETAGYLVVSDHTAKTWILS